MRIPEVREELLKLAEAVGGPKSSIGTKLEELAEELKRRPRALTNTSENRVYRALTEELKGEVRSLKAARPNWTQVEIARHFGINPGRVSEILNGRRQ